MSAAATVYLIVWLAGSPLPHQLLQPSLQTCTQRLEAMRMAGAVAWCETINPLPSAPSADQEKPK